MHDYPSYRISLDLQGLMTQHSCQRSIWPIFAEIETYHSYYPLYFSLSHIQVVSHFLTQNTFYCRGFPYFVNFCACEARVLLHDLPVSFHPEENVNLIEFMIMLEHKTITDR